MVLQNLVKKFRIFALGAAMLPLSVLAQSDDLLNELNKGQVSKPDYISSTFKSTHITNSQSVENLGMGILDFRISHRFGQMSQGVQNFFGLDNATTRIGLDYGITDWLMIGLGHSTLNKENDGFIKLKLLRQKEKGGKMPFTVCYLGGVSIQTMAAPSLPAGDEYYFSNRLYYTNQLLVARKFNEHVSLQVMPTYVHYNLVDSSKYSNNLLALGIGGRFKLSRRMALTAEYYYVIPSTSPIPDFTNSFSLGLDIETGGHVFQLILTNSSGMTERTFIGQTTDNFFKGDLHFGFNISRVFTIVQPKDFHNSRNKIW